jgi:adenylylsulfate kinase
MKIEPKQVESMLETRVGRETREKQNGHRSVVLWFTGLSGAGKTTLAYAVEERLHRMACRSYVIDGDVMRTGLCRDLDFTMEGRNENIRRVGEVAKVLLDAGIIAITAFISPLRNQRRGVRALVDPGDFLEVFCRCPLPVCEKRDPKGLYRRARAGQIPDFTGISSPYEDPETPELLLDTAKLEVRHCVEMVIALLAERGVIPVPDTPAL